MKEQTTTLLIKKVYTENLLKCCHPLQELSMTKDMSSSRPLQELSMTKDASSSHPLQRTVSDQGRESEVFPKLTEFYTLRVAPEIVCPQHPIGLPIHDLCHEVLLFLFCACINLITLSLIFDYVNGYIYSYTKTVTSPWDILHG